eukprot:GHVP01006787.1.p1 GENE.GHVP01006787.1~~GHVP01006787.1.p1  ORF type:complete len:922 (+),score=22.58 GHVP01006787.1:98-2767(+)
MASQIQLLTTHKFLLNLTPQNPQTPNSRPPFRPPQQRPRPQNTFRPPGTPASSLYSFHNPLHNPTDNARPLFTQPIPLPPGPSNTTTTQPLHPHIRRAVVHIIRAIIRRYNMETSKNNLKEKMESEILTILGLMFLYAPGHLNEIKDKIHQTLQRRNIPPELAAPSNWFSLSQIFHDPPHPQNTSSNQEDAFHLQPHTEPHWNYDETYIYADTTEDITTEEPHSLPPQDIITSQENHSTTEHNYDTMDNNYEFYRLQTDIPTTTHTIATTINTQTRPAIIDTGATLSATCCCTFPTFHIYRHNTTRIFTTANGQVKLPILQINWHFPTLNITLPSISTAIIPCTRDHPRLIGLNIIHNPKIQEFIQATIFHKTPPITHHKDEAIHALQPNDYLHPIKETPIKLIRTTKPLPTPEQHHLTRTPPNVIKAIQLHIQSHVNRGILTPTTPSIHSAPLFTIPKSNGSWRLISDYSLFNQCYHTNTHHLPDLFTHIQSLSASHYYTFIDLKEAFFQIPLAPDPPITTTFNHQHFRYLRLPMGLSPSPAILQHLLTKHLHPHSKYTKIYLDDIIIHADSINDCKEYTNKVISTLQQYHWTISLTKSQIHPLPAPITKYGYTFGNSTIIPHWTNDTMDSISNTLRNTPLHLHTWQHLIGIINIFRPTIPHFSSIIAPLLRHLKHNKTFPPDQADFDAISQIHLKLQTAKLSSPHNLIHAHLITDYAPTGSSALLYDTDNFHTTSPIICYSKAIPRTKDQAPIHPPASSTTEGETNTALHFAIRTRQSYFPQSLTIHTDSINAIHWLRTTHFPNTLPPIIQRKLAHLRQYGPFFTSYISTRNNPADILTHKTSIPRKTNRNKVSKVLEPDPMDQLTEHKHENPSICDDPQSIGNQLI